MFSAMKSRKQKQVQTGGSKKKVPRDVSPSTSLPPLVEGPPTCSLRVTISRILWEVHKPPSSTFVRLRWWGESTNGTNFFPRDGSQLSQKTIKTTACFAVRCGPKHFASYLTDMGPLVLDVLTKADHFPVARAHVTGISHLSLSQPISGFYTLVSPTSEKMGELQVSLSLEQLTEAHDSSGSCPNTDVSVEVAKVAKLTVPSESRSLSAGSGKESVCSNSVNTPRGKDHLYFQNDKGKDESVENQRLTNRSQNSQTGVNPSSQETCGQTSNDILSVITERGEKLRNAMVLSASKCDVDSAPALKDTPLPLPKDNAQPPSIPFSSPSGMLLQNILHADSSPKHVDVAVVSDYELDVLADMEDTAIDLLLGGTSPLCLWDGEDLLSEFLSDHSSVCVDSELDDPQHDQSLLEKMFYSFPMLEIKPDETEAESQGTVSSSKNQPNQLTQSGPKISGGRKSELQRAPDAAATLPGLSSELLNLLNSIRVARVTIDSLTVPIRKNTSSAGKPPRPRNSKKCTYFVEYALPVASTSQHDGGKSVDGKVTRAVSSKVTRGVVRFHQRSVFPVHFSTATIKQWWQSDLIFKIYLRQSEQKKPVLIGKAVYQLQRLLQSNQLSQSVVLPVQGLEGTREAQEIGPLMVMYYPFSALFDEQVSLDFATDSKVFSSGKSQSTLASQTAPSAHLDQTGTVELPAPPIEDSGINVRTLQRPVKEPVPHPSLNTSSHKQWQQTVEDPQVLLHTLLMVPDGKDFSFVPTQSPNVYLDCKLFWYDETASSIVSRGQTNPTFNFAQVIPVALTNKLLERMKNNVMVIEVWQKAGSSGQDRLLGLVKLPLHQFYLSFRDPKVTHLLLQAQYPVLAVDRYMPVIDLFSGRCNGNLRVVLAMGGSEQIVAFQRSRDEQYDNVPHPVKPFYRLDHQQRLKSKVIVTQQERMREHLFVIKVERVNGLTPLQSTVWGEADCYVQYSFPYQDGEPVDQSLIESSVNLKSFRTTTTLCVPYTEFGHTEIHVLLAPEGVPVQTLLLSSLSGQGRSSSAGIQFEMWCRYYYPNVRDQLVAEGLLPLSKLCAMVTMQRQHPKEAQVFSLPLIPRTDNPTGHQPQPSGLLDVCIEYKHRPVRATEQPGRGAAAPVVTLVIQVHRASGLLAAARVLSEQDGRFSYLASEGVNTYVTVQLSFLPESEMRCTRTVARTFCPEFDHHIEMSCDVLLQRSSGEICSLAERLEDSSAVFTVWNKDNRKAMSMSKPKDVMLGTVKIPLEGLIHKRTGISGWFGVRIPQETSSQQQHVLVGGIELSISFAHHSDRERVIRTAQGLGWVMRQSDTEMQDGEEDWTENMEKISLTFSMPRVWIPFHCLLLPGHSDLERSTYCYFRYKFYDQEAFCSQMKHPSVRKRQKDRLATVNFEGSGTVELRRTQPLMWYLREERLEVQVWVAFNKDKSRRPTDTDRLVGSAFVDLSSLAKTPTQKMFLSGVYPLFRRSADDLQGAALRVHITSMGISVPMGSSAGADTQMDSDSQEELSLNEVESTDRTPSPITPIELTQSSDRIKPNRTTSDIKSVQHTESSKDGSFPVTIVVDQAMHLNLKACPLAERSEGILRCCVSYVTADSAEPVSTAVINDTDCPVWDHQQECRLSKQLLVDPQQSLVFKVWHKGEMDRVLGFACVDLSPLVYGFPSVCGWYNITDFSGQCHGQLKVSVTPLRGVPDLRGQRNALNEKATKNSCAFPLTYHTATYSSFPSHISHYPEQKILSSDPKSSTEDISPSSSFLFTALRKKLSELDNMQRYYSNKISAPAFPCMTEDDSCNKQEEERESQTDPHQLLLKSTQLVEEVNNIISGLRGHHLEIGPSNLQSSSPSSPGVDNNPQCIPECITLLLRASHASQDVSPLPSPPPKMPEDQTDSEAEEEKDRNHNKVVSEDESEERVEDDETACIRYEEANDDEEEDEDYEETVVEPRHLNEVTSLTDKTSPWTSILTDLDIISVESLEAPEDPDLSQSEEEQRDTHNSSSQHECTIEEESDSLSGSAADDSDTERDAKGTVQDIEIEAKDAQDSQRPTWVPVEVPNFFLPSRQLEASMRTIKLAPSFSQLSSDPEQLPTDSVRHRRGRPQRRNMSPSSLKKETERIAKIFAAHFNVKS